MILAMAAVSCTHKSATTGATAVSDNSPVLAKVGDKSITKNMYETELNTIPDQVRGYFLKQGGPQAFLDQIISKELLYQEAVKEGIDKDQRLQAAVDNYRKISMVKLLLQKKIGADLNVTDNEAQKYYDSHKEDFKMKEGKAAGQIVPFDAIKSLIKQRMAGEKQEQAFASYVNELKKSAKVQINDQAVKDLAKEMPALTNTPTGLIQGMPGGK